MPFGIQEPVSAAIWHLRENYCTQEAIFLSERLHAEVATEESSFLLATSYFRNGQIVRAMHTLEKLTRPPAKKEYAKVQHILLDNTGLSRDELPSLYQTDTGVAFWLIAEYLRRSNLSENAQPCFLLSLRSNPYLWSSLQALYESGHTVQLGEIYATENCPDFCSKAPFMAVSRYAPDRPCVQEPRTHAPPESE